MLVPHKNTAMNMRKMSDTVARSSEIALKVMTAKGTIAHTMRVARSGAWPEICPSTVVIAPTTSSTRTTQIIRPAVRLPCGSARCVMRASTETSANAESPLQPFRRHQVREERHEHSSRAPEDSARRCQRRLLKAACDEPRHDAPLDGPHGRVHEKVRRRSRLRVDRSHEEEDSDSDGEAD